MWIPIQPVTVENSCLQLTNSPLPSSLLFDGARRGSLALSVRIEREERFCEERKGYLIGACFYSLQGGLIP